MPFVLKFSLDFPKLSSSKEATVEVFKMKVFFSVLESLCIKFQADATHICRIIKEILFKKTYHACCT